MSSTFVYGGQELDLFAQATNWKGYVRRLLTPYVRGDVLEVGAGIGTTTKLLCDGSQSSWACVEPDASHGLRLREMAATLPQQTRFDVIGGTIDDVPHERTFDSILYVDVLEHIGDDHHEFATAARLLKSGGVIVVLAPAHPWLYSPFDRSIGHHRRYTRPMLRRIAPNALICDRLWYLDAAGVAASLANRFLLSRAMPTRKQVRAWDRVLVPISRAIDPLLLHFVGKSVFGVWRRP
jgi:SAM-dependent methyltransferase